MPAAPYFGPDLMKRLQRAVDSYWTARPHVLAARADEAARTARGHDADLVASRWWVDADLDECAA